MATYLTYVLDPSIKELVTYIREFAPHRRDTYDELLGGLERDLDELLETHDMDLMELFQDIAIE